jgi:hypothetical protein
MHIKLLLLLFAVMLFSCANKSNSQQQESSETTEVVSSGHASNKTETQSGAGNWEKLIMKELRDAKGQLVLEMPFPSSWEMPEQHAQGEPTITGPKGVKVIDYPAQSFIYTNDPQLQNVYYQSGQQLRYFPGVNEIIQQDLTPWCNNRGLEYVKHYEIPEVSRIDKWYNDQLYKAVPMQTQVKAIGTEWKKADGTPFFLLIRLFVSNSATMQTWYYMASSLEAESQYFEQARKQLILSLANTRYALQPIMDYNRVEAEKAGRSWAAHNQRMAQSQAVFEASQRAFVNKSNAINDAIMGNWKQQNASSDKQHGQFIDAIREENNAVNTSSGQQYKVNSHYSNYWMNSNGEYISTNQTDYNPNLDENMNNLKWEELKKID